jgi:hypothetical protein
VAREEAAVAVGSRACSLTTVHCGATEGTLSGFNPAFYSEYALLVVLFGFVASHGAYFGRRLVELAEARKEAGASEKAQVLALRRRRLQRLSYWISMLNILISAAVSILAAYAQAG